MELDTILSMIAGLFTFISTYYILRFKMNAGGRASIISAIILAIIIAAVIYFPLEYIGF